MSKNQQTFKNLNKTLPSLRLDDEDLIKNQPNKRGNKKQLQKMQRKQSILTISQNTPITTYRIQNSQERKEQLKWKYLERFWNIATKAHYVHQLKHQTLFLSYSMAEKTVQMIDDSLPFQYWTAACLYLSMKYEEIYPPRLKSIEILIKKPLDGSTYAIGQLRVLNFLNLNLNFTSINTYLSQFLHAVTNTQRFNIFYLMEIALGIRTVLKDYNFKEIVVSIAYILSSHNLFFKPHQLIDGVKFQRMQSCAKLIMINQSRASERFPVTFRKYRQSRYYMVSYGSIPLIQSLTALIIKKTGKRQDSPKIVGITKDQGKTDCQ